MSFAFSFAIRSRFVRVSFATCSRFVRRFVRLKTAPIGSGITGVNCKVFRGVEENINVDDGGICCVGFAGSGLERRVCRA